MKSLLKSLLFIAVALFAVDRIGGQMMRLVNKHSQDIFGPKLRYLAEEADEDVILLGTSRCNFHYVPSIISDSLDMSVYNGGFDATNCVYSHYILLNQILHHHTPKLVCLEVSVNDYSETNKPFNTISFFAPYIGRCKQADSVFMEADNYWLYRLSHLYRYNAKAVSNISGLIINERHGEDNGYIPLPKPKYSPDTLVAAKTPQVVDDLKVHYLQKFISLCKNRGVELVFMVSPSYLLPDEDLYDVIKGLAQRNNVPFLDYHTKKIFIDRPEYFKDYGHLWDESARMYSSMFAGDLRRIICE